MLFSVGSSLVVFGALLAHIIFTYVIYPVFISPLRKVPKAHSTVPWNPLWILRRRLTQREVSTIYEAHRQSGDLIRLGPNEVSVNCPEGLKVVYGGNYDRHKWFYNVSANDGVPNMLASLDSKSHAQARRLFSGVYTKTYIQNSSDVKEIFRTIISERMMPYLRDHTDSGSLPVDAVMVSSAIAYDFAIAFIFGLNRGSNLLKDHDLRNEMFEIHSNIESQYQALGELHAVFQALDIVGIHLMPSKMTMGYEKFYDHISNLCKAADADKAGTAIVHDHGSQNYDKSQFQYPKHEKLSIELFDQTVAAYDTVAPTIIYLIYEMSRNIKLQNELRTELSSLQYDGDIPNFHEVDALPLLDAIVQETVRRYPASPIPLPRVVPTEGVHLCGYQIPGGTRISSSSYTLHRNEKAFPDAEEWNPHRWLDCSPEQLQEMKRWFWGFGSGPRMCIGLYFGMLELKCIATAIYKNFETSIAEAGDMTPTDSFTARPTDEKLFLNFKNVVQTSGTG